MTYEELSRWFRRFKYDPLFRDEKGRRTVPVACLCEFAGISRGNLYHMLRGEIPCSPNMHDRLAQAIRAVEAGLRWRRVGLTWQITDPQFERLPRYDATRRHERHQVAA